MDYAKTCFGRAFSGSITTEVTAVLFNSTVHPFRGGSYLYDGQRDDASKNRQPPFKNDCWAFFHRREAIFSAKSRRKIVSRRFSVAGSLPETLRSDKKSFRGVLGSPSPVLERSTSMKNRKFAFFDAKLTSFDAALTSFDAN